MYKALLFFLLGSMTVFSQKNIKDSLQFNGNFNLAGSLTDGLKFQRKLQLDFNTTFEKPSWRSESYLSFRYRDADNQVLNRDWDVLTLYNFHINGNKKWSPFLIGNFQTNVGYGLKFRLGYGGGITYNPTIKGINWIYLSAAAIYFESRFNQAVFINSDRIGNNRDMLRVGLRYNMSTQIYKDIIFLNSDGWFLQSTREGSDFIVGLNFGLEYKLSELLALTMNYRFNHENVFLSELKTNQQFTSIGIRVSY